MRGEGWGEGWGWGHGERNDTVVRVGTPEGDTHEKRDELVQHEDLVRVRVRREGEGAGEGEGEGEGER